MSLILARRNKGIGSRFYSYDAMNRETQVTQGASTAGGADAVDSKLVNFTYNADGHLLLHRPFRRPHRLVWQNGNQRPTLRRVVDEEQADEIGCRFLVRKAFGTSCNKRGDNRKEA